MSIRLVHASTDAVGRDERGECKASAPVPGASRRCNRDARPAEGRTSTSDLARQRRHHIADSTPAGHGDRCRPTSAAVIRERAAGACPRLVVINIRYDWHQCWIDYRLLAEHYRKQQALAVLGWSLSGRAVRALVEQQEETGSDRTAWVVWLFAAMVRAYAELELLAKQSHIMRRVMELGRRRIEEIDLTRGHSRRRSWEPRFTKSRSQCCRTCRAAYSCSGSSWSKPANVS